MDKRSRKATAAIPGSPGSLHQSGTKPETPQETWGSGCRPEDVPLPQASRTPVKWIPQKSVINIKLAAMINRCLSAAQPGWLALRKMLWPDWDEAEHLKEMDAFVAEGATKAAFVASDSARR